MEKEIWRAIKGYEDLYEVSNYGKVRSLFRYKKILKPIVGVQGYLYVTLYDKNKKQKSKRIHRLVAQAFISNPDNLPFVNHKDEDVKNNVYSNLEWTTTQENIIKRYEIGIVGNNYKRVSQFDKDGNLVGSFSSSYEAERITGISRTHIGGCCRGERLTAGGYVWKFEIEEPKKIEKITVREKTLGFPDGEWTARNMDKAFAIKVNELIDEINNLKEK